MNRIARAVMVARLVELLRENDGWAGETHVQKSVYFLQRLLSVPTGWKFSLYKFGPFSFDLRDELAEMQADGWLNLESQRPPYGPRLMPGGNFEIFRDKLQPQITPYETKIEFIAQALAGQGVGGLERVATALFVTDELGISGETGGPEKLNELKPHVPVSEAVEAFSELAQIRSSAPLG